MKDKDFVFKNWLRLIKKGKKDLLRVKKENIKKKEILQLLEIYNQYDYFAVFSTPSNTIDITSFDKKDLKESFTKCYDSIFIEIFINKNE
jgi:signal transduction histidine kinase